MKRLILSVMLLVAAVGMASAQKFALIDMEYILKQIPSYQQANQQMESLSKQWQSQIDCTKITRKAPTRFQLLRKPARKKLS